MNATPLERIRLREKCVEMYFVLFQEYTAMGGVLQVPYTSQIVIKVKNKERNGTE